MKSAMQVFSKKAISRCSGRGRTLLPPSYSLL